MKVPLILGTAEFSPEGYAGKPRPAKAERLRIFSLAKEAGINIIDTAESYNCQDIIRTEAKGFSIYTKTRDWKVTLNWGQNELRGILYHYKKQEQEIELPFIHRWVNLGVSVYNRGQLPENVLRILQVPYNFNNRLFEDTFGMYRTVFVRSAFDRGRLLKIHSLNECLAFAAARRPDGIIIGVSSSKELEQILKAYY